MDREREVSRLGEGSRGRRLCEVLQCSRHQLRSSRQHDRAHERRQVACLERPQCAPYNRRARFLRRGSHLRSGCETACSSSFAGTKQPRTPARQVSRSSQNSTMLNDTSDSSPPVPSIGCMPCHLSYDRLQPRFCRSSQSRSPHGTEGL